MKNSKKRSQKGRIIHHGNFDFVFLPIFCALGYTDDKSYAFFKKLIYSYVYECEHGSLQSIQSKTTGKKEKGFVLYKKKDIRKDIGIDFNVNMVLITFTVNGWIDFRDVTDEVVAIKIKTSSLIKFMKQNKSFISTMCTDNSRRKWNRDFKKRMSWLKQFSAK